MRHHSLVVAVFVTPVVDPKRRSRSSWSLSLALRQANNTYDCERDKGFCLDSTTMTLSVCVQEKSRHFTARTCNCIIIVLDAIKPITHKRLIKAINKIDQITLEELEILDKLPHYCPIRGDTAFCSLDCRQQQMAQDEWKEKGKPAKESTVATSGKAGKGGRASTAV
ncbi:hypothetical protein Bca52824_082910 [Brassica carinata]|uniref:FLZ-type domain-containing protein n=2 Tax=Brassica TaxID=3705 RepID=A0A8X7PND9_BRACI|nr:hypothetical protein Bca52824_082910 [Brassica carinata]